MDWKSCIASMSISVNAASSSSTSRKPSARQNRLATSSGISVCAATWPWGQAVARGYQHPVDDQEVEDVVSGGPVDLLIGAPQVAEQEADPGQRLHTGDVAVLDGIRRIVRHPPTLDIPGPARPLRRVTGRAYTGRVAQPGERRHDPGLGLGPRAVLVPIKAFHQAKGRLDHALSPSERSALARSMAAQVLEAGGTAGGRRGVRRQRTWPTGRGPAAPSWCGSRAGASTARSRPAWTTYATRGCRR